MICIGKHALNFQYTPHCIQSKAEACAVIMLQAVKHVIHQKADTPGGLAF